MAKAVAFFLVFGLGLKVRAIRAGFPGFRASGRVLDVHGVKLKMKKCYIQFTSATFVDNL